jgi:hypothetical protein
MAWPRPVCGQRGLVVYEAKMSGLDETLVPDQITTYECPVCDYQGLRYKPYELWPPLDGVELQPPYEDLLGLPSYEVCPCCGYGSGTTTTLGQRLPYRSRSTGRNGSDAALLGSVRPTRALANNQTRSSS